MDRQRLAVGGCYLSVVLIVSGCSSTGEPSAGARGAAPAVELPLSVEDGVGSQHGNYAAQMDGEMRGAAGERCVIFNWDRPLTKDFAVRLRSASCESKDRPGQMICTEISRTVIPIAESSLAAKESESSP
jgi:hypothetical protein